VGSFLAAGQCVLALHRCPFFYHLILPLSLPLRPQSLSLPPDSLDEITWIGWGKVFSEWFNPELIQLDEHGGHSRIGVSKENASTNANKFPTIANSFKNGLPVNVVLKLLRSVPFLTIALDGKSAAPAFGDEVNTVCANRPLRLHPITGGE